MTKSKIKNVLPPEPPSLDFPVIAVRWFDCFKERGPVRAEKAKDLGNVVLVIVGFLIHEDDKYITIAQEYEEYDKDCRDVVRIPRVNVLGIRFL